MTAHAEDLDLNADEHPALLLVRAHELESLAQEFYEESKLLRGEAAALKARAERNRDGQVFAPPKRQGTDRLMGAAALAVEDMGSVFTARELANVLQIRDMQRMARIMLALEEQSLVSRVGEDGWRAVDPEEARVRDGLRELGTCSREELAEHLEVPEQALTAYIEMGEQRGWANVMSDGHLMFLKAGPERIITRHPHGRPPEKDPPSYADAPRRGEPVRVVDHGQRGQQGSVPGQRHRLKLRDKRREAMDNAKRDRAERDRLRSAENPTPRRKKK